MQDVVVESFADIKKRLNEIADQVANTDLPLEEALTLYEEAVNLGLHATNLLEEDISEDEMTEVRDGSASTTEQPSEQTPEQPSEQSSEEGAVSHVSLSEEASTTSSDIQKHELETAE